MSVTINMYKFNKKLNSTKTPDNTVSFDTYECLFLNPQSIMNPTIVIERPVVEKVMLEYSYAYVPDLARYYFISNVVISDSKLFTYYLQVDVLASFKTDFLPTSQYVLRCTNFYNDDLIDNIYPIIPMPDASRFSSYRKDTNTVFVLNNKTGVWADRTLFHQTYTDGAILFGITGQGDVSCDHYVTSVSYFKTFINDVVTAVPTGGSWGNVPTGVQTALSNFLQYITYVKWIPFFPIIDNLGSLVTTVYLGDQSFSLSAYKVLAGASNQPVRFDLQVPDHPLYSRHRYYNFTPFREVNLFYPLIGNIPLDTTKLYKQFSENTVYIQVTMIIDLATADTEYTVVRTDSGYISGPNHFTDGLLANGVVNIGVDLSLSEYSMSVEAALASGVSYMLGHSINEWLNPKAGGSITHTSSSGATHGGHGGTWGEKTGSKERAFWTGSTMRQYESADKTWAQRVAEDIYDAIGNLIDLSPIANALESFGTFAASSFGQVSTSGHSGSFLMSVCTMPVVYCWFKKHADEDYDRFGRPFSDTKTLALISGFCVCRGANYSGVNLHPLKPEQEAINKLLNSGIYIET